MDNKALELMEVFGRLYRKNIETRIDAVNRKLSEGRTLLILKERESAPMSVLELSEHLRVTSPFVSQLLNSMVQDELIIRTKDSKDRRIVRVSLTEQGKLKASEVYQFSLKLYEGLAEHLGQEESRLLANLLEKSIDYLDCRVFDSERKRQ